LDPTFVPFFFHWYTGAVPPLVGVAVKVTEVPEQIVVADAPILALAGRSGFTVAVVVPAGLVQPFTVAVTEYVPLAAVVAPVIVGFCNAELKLFGPVHEYVAPDTLLAVKLNVDPSQTAPPLPAVGAVGIAFTVTSSTLLAAAPLQSAEQITRAWRLYQVV